MAVKNQIEHLEEVFDDQMGAAWKQFQLVELVMKSILITHHQIIKEAVKGNFDYEVPVQSIDNMAMTSLINHLKKFKPQKKLIANLNTYKGKRDQFIHKGYSKLYDKQASKTKRSLIDGNQELHECLKLGQECLAKLENWSDNCEKLLNDN